MRKQNEKMGEKKSYSKHPKVRNLKSKKGVTVVGKLLFAKVRNTINPCHQQISGYLVNLL